MTTWRRYSRSRTARFTRGYGRHDNTTGWVIGGIIATAVIGVVALAASTWTTVEGTLSTVSHVDEWDREWRSITIYTGGNNYITTGSWEYTFTRTFTFELDGKHAATYIYKWDKDVSEADHDAREVPATTPAFEPGMRVRLGGWGNRAFMVDVLATK